jgi:hypothetical protein
MLQRMRAPTAYKVYHAAARQAFWWLMAAAMLLHCAAALYAVMTDHFDRSIVLWLAGSGSAVQMLVAVTMFTVAQMRRALVESGDGSGTEKHAARRLQPTAAANLVFTMVMAGVVLTMICAHGEIDTSTHSADNAGQTPNSPLDDNTVELAERARYATLVFACALVTTALAAETFARLIARVRAPALVTAGSVDDRDDEPQTAAFVPSGGLEGNEDPYQMVGTYHTIALSSGALGGVLIFGLFGMMAVVRPDGTDMRTARGFFFGSSIVLGLAAVLYALLFVFMDLLAPAKGPLRKKAGAPRLTNTATLFALFLTATMAIVFTVALSTMGYFEYKYSQEVSDSEETHRFTNTAKQFLVSQELFTFFMVLALLAPVLLIFGVRTAPFGGVFLQTLLRAGALEVSKGERNLPLWTRMLDWLTYVAFSAGPYFIAIVGLFSFAQLYNPTSASLGWLMGAVLPAALLLALLFIAESYAQAWWRRSTNDEKDSFFGSFATLCDIATAAGLVLFAAVLVLLGGTLPAAELIDWSKAVDGLSWGIAGIEVGAAVVVVIIALFWLLYESPARKDAHAVAGIGDPERKLIVARMWTYALVLFLSALFFFVCHVDKPHEGNEQLAQRVTVHAVRALHVLVAMLLAFQNTYGTRPSLKVH